jgi:hypothetical protein
MRRWERGAREAGLAIVALAALGLLAPTVGRADVPGYTFSVPVQAKGDLADYSLLQMGDVNNKGQFCLNMVGGGGEKEYVWDGAQLIKLSEDNITVSDGATFSVGNVWSPTGISDKGKVAWTADMADGTGPHYIMLYDLATKQYTIVAKPGQPAPGGGTYGDSGVGPSGRMLTDINNLDQVVWNVAVAGADGNDHDAIFMFDLPQQKPTAIARNGMKTTDGKTITEAYWPDTNDQSQVSFSASVDGSDSYGIYRWDKGNISPIVPAGSKIDGVTIGSARFARIANNGDIVCVVDTNADQGGAGEGNSTDDTGVAYYSAADKSVHLVVKPGDALPGGSIWQGVEPSRRVVGLTSHGQAFVIGVRADGGDGIYMWQGGKLEALILGNTTVPGLGKVDGVSKGVGGVSGYHFGVSDDGHVVFPAVVDGTEGYVLAAPPAPTAGP